MREVEEWLMPSEVPSTCIPMPCHVQEELQRRAEAIENEKLLRAKTLEMGKARPDTN